MSYIISMVSCVVISFTPGWNFENLVYCMAVLSYIMTDAAGQTTTTGTLL